MTTLTNPPLAGLLDALYSEADASRVRIEAMRAGLTDMERAAIGNGTIDYRAYYARLKDEPLAVERSTGTLLYMMARSMRARTIIEYGMSFAISTLHLAAALRDNGGGTVITTEFEPAKAIRGRDNLEKAGLLDLVEIREGDALETLSANIPDPVDLLLLDGAKHLYPAILDRIEPHLRPGALVIADNADRAPDYLDRVRTPASGYLSVPFGEDVELSLKIG